MTFFSFACWRMEEECRASGRVLTSQGRLPIASFRLLKGIGLKGYRPILVNLANVAADGLSSISLPTKGCCSNYKLEQEAERRLKSFIEVAINIVRLLEGIIKNTPSSAAKFNLVCLSDDVSSLLSMTFESGASDSRPAHGSPFMVVEMGTCKPLFALLFLPCLLRHVSRVSAPPSNL